MAIAHDNSTTSSFAGPGTSTSLTYSKTNTGSDLVLWVFVECARISGGSVAGFTLTCTYNSVSMTEIRSGTTTGAVLQTSSTSAGSCLFYLLGPATGANNVVVTLSGTADRILSGASSYTGVSGVNN